MRTVFLIVAGLLAGGTSDPNATVNQSFPIRQMDGFFNGLSRPPPPDPPDYTHEPGYAPAYPPY